jgi:hypothetical protein
MSKFSIVTLILGAGLIFSGVPAQGRSLSDAEIWTTYGGKWDNDSCGDWQVCYDGAANCESYSDVFPECGGVSGQQTQGGNTRVCHSPYEEGEYFCEEDSRYPGSHVCLKMILCANEERVVNGVTEYHCVNDPQGVWVDLASAPNALIADDCPW